MPFITVALYAILTAHEQLYTFTLCSSLPSPMHNHAQQTRQAPVIPREARIFMILRWTSTLRAAQLLDAGQLATAVHIQGYIY